MATQMATLTGGSSWRQSSGTSASASRRAAPADAGGAIIALNLHRRHLSVEQRAIVADKAAKLGRGRPVVNAPSGAFTQADAAEALSVSRRSVQRARSISSEPEKLPQNAGVIGETAERLATEYGVHKATVERAAATVDAIPPDDIAAVLQGEKRLRDVKPHVANNSGDNEWYTPEPYIAAARAVMDGIDLDPASCAAANAVVGATRYYTRENDGLSRLWSGRVWLNPPFATDLIGKFAEKMAAHYESGDVTEACVLVNNATETAWFARLIENASAVCFPRGRVRFWHPDKVSAPLQGQAVIYLGDNPDEFRRKFAEFGWTASL